MTQTLPFTPNFLLSALSVAAYTTDADGRITFYNEAAANLWGRRPKLGETFWCGSLRLFLPSGQPLPQEDCPMGKSLKAGYPVYGVIIVAERPDSTRIPFTSYPSLLRDEAGHIVGGINILVEAPEGKNSEIELERLGAIVSSSDDAIISKTLDGRITSWNVGATRIFGYEPEEMIGQSIAKIIPPELLHEEKEIIYKLRHGKRIEHFDTVRLGKNGRRIDISLTVSPLKDKLGLVVGASKVARDISERKRSDKLQRLLFDELNHRVKNTLAMIQSIASQSLRRSTSPREFVASFNGRIEALARAHNLLVHGKMQGTDVAALVKEQVILGSQDGTRTSIAGAHIRLDERSTVQLALVLHELATNARKYGALAVPEGKLTITWSLEESSRRQLYLEWKENGVPDVKAPTSRGFGTTLIERSLEARDGEATVRYEADGLICNIRLPLTDDLQNSSLLPLKLRDAMSPGIDPLSFSLTGKRVLIVEDEALLAMEIESQLVAEGCEVVGPAPTIEKAQRLIAEKVFDVAIIDANLGGHPVDEIAAALTRRNIPFAFATGYGREALPRSFQEAPILSKPFTPNQLSAMLGTLLTSTLDRSRVVNLKQP